MAPAGESLFPTTRWTLIVAAKSSPEARRAALTELVRTYWQPLYVFLRKRGLDAASAQDGVQDVLVQLLERDVVGTVTPEKGRLRAYLRTVAANYLASRHTRDVAAKRGAGAVVVPIDAALADRLAADDAETPERAYERAWAHAVMTRAMAQLEVEFTAGARKGPFAVVAQFFGPGPTPSYREVAQAHGMSLPQLKAFLHRARVRFRELVALEVADTVEGAEHVEDELEQLMRAMA